MEGSELHHLESWVRATASPLPPYTRSMEPRVRPERVRFARTETCWICSTCGQHLTADSFPTTNDKNIAPEDRPRWSECRVCEELGTPRQGNHSRKSCKDPACFRGSPLTDSVTARDVDARPEEDEDEIDTLHHEGVVRYRIHRESPADLSNSLVFSSVMEPDPELGVDTLDEVPLELYKLSTGETVAARLGYLTGLLKDLGDMGHEDPEAEVHVENGTWRQVGTLALPSGHCLALDPRKGGRRISFQVVPGDYVAEVFEFNDADLGYFECDYGIRIRRGA